MFDLSPWIDLPLVWGGLIATAVLMYVLLDGFDLGVGILFPFAPSEACRHRMIQSIAPFWDGNETWLVLGGGGLLAAFPLACAILLPAFYVPIVLMLLGLVLRGVAFEFRFKARADRRFFWDHVFHGGSLVAAFTQGIVLGGLLQGVKVEGRNFSGSLLDGFTAFSMMTGGGVVAGYALLGATWTVLKTGGATQVWARKAARRALVYVGGFMALVSFCTPFLHPVFEKFWFETPGLLVLSPLPLAACFCFVMAWRDLAPRASSSDLRPFLWSMGLFLTGYLGLGGSVYPWIVPFHYTLHEAAASGPSLSLMLVGVVPTLPLVLGYTAWCYRVFRGKTCEHNEGHGYV